MSKLVTSQAQRAQLFKTIFPAFNPVNTTGITKVIHPTAVYEDPKGDLYILLINGLQPKSATDFFVLWNIRMTSEALIQSGKSLREEHDAMSYVDRVKN